MSFAFKLKVLPNRKAHNLFLLFNVIFFLVGCETFNLKTRENLPHIHPSSSPSRQIPSGSKEPKDSGIEMETTTEAQAPVVPPKNTSSALPPPPPAPLIPAVPKIGFILGAGGAKTFAHIGFLHELSRYKIPVHAIGGVEFATPIAALYAHRTLPNDVEWQMFKLKDEDVKSHSILSSFNKINDASVLKDFAAVAFNKEKVEDFKIPFACPTLNLKRNQVYFMNQGALDQVLYFCMAYPPYYRPYLGNISAIRDINSLAYYLKQKGANYIVFVNVLQGPTIGKSLNSDASLVENILWNEIASTYNRTIPGVDSVINLDTSEFGILDFDKRRDIMNKGAESAALQLKNMTRKWGL